MLFLEGKDEGFFVGFFFIIIYLFFKSGILYCSHLFEFGEKKGRIKVVLLTLNWPVFHFG